MSDERLNDASAKANAANSASEFEFLRNLPFGPYLPVDSLLHRLDPRTRILLVVGLITALLVFRSLPELALIIAAVLAGYRLGQVPYGPLLRGWRTALPLLLILALLQILFRVGGRDEPALFMLGPLAVSAADLWAALLLIVRFSGLIAVLGLGASSISESELTHGLESLLRPLNAVGIPVTDFVMVIQVTMRYFPLLAQVAERIAKAQASRGADWQPTGWNLLQRARQITPLLVPLFVASLRRAENMALAMDARGYGSLPVRTSMLTLRYGRPDLVALALVVLLLVVLILV